MRGMSMRTLAKKKEGTTASEYTLNGRGDHQAPHLLAIASPSLVRQVNGLNRRGHKE